MLAKALFSKRYMSLSGEVHYSKLPDNTKGHDNGYNMHKIGKPGEQRAKYLDVKKIQVHGSKNYDFNFLSSKNNSGSLCRKISEYMMFFFISAKRKF